MGTGYTGNCRELGKESRESAFLYRQILRSLNTPRHPLTHAARLAKKTEVFLFGSEERSLHSIADRMDAARYSLSIL